MSLFAIAQPLDLDPLEVAQALSATPGTLLLHSQQSGVRSGRSALLFDPRWTLTLEPGERPRWSGDVPAPDPPDTPPARLALELARPWKRDGLPRPCFAGLAGMLGYDLGAAAAGIEAPHRSLFALPDAWLSAYDCALVFGGNAPPTLWVMDLAPLVPARLALHERCAQARDALARAVSALRARRARLLDKAPGVPAGSASAPRAVWLPDRAWHRRAVERIREHLRAGDAYQINLTSFVEATVAADPWTAFLHQARRNPVPFAAYLRLPEATITCHSPERLLRLRGRRARSSPIKGTVARAPGALRRLLESEKDRAEHVMIVDLVRNDLGRACEFGSVHPHRLMTSLRLDQLVHLVSHIDGQVRPPLRAQLLSDLFPGGSITGAPKRRAMQIIAELEPTRRGPYTGSIGYSDRGGAADWNIAIRTAVWQNGRVAFGCGGGIVIDSDPDQEYEEAVLKARSFVDTLSFTASASPLRARVPALPETCP